MFGEMPMSDPKDNVTASYEATVSHWTHAEDTRWSLLSNYFTGSSILILAWAALFTSQAPYRRLVSTILAIGGVLISFLWAGLSHRANGFVRIYSELGMRLERELVKDLKATGNNPDPWFPFNTAENYRSALNRPARYITSRFTVVSVPLVFALIYAIFAWIGIHSPQVNPK
jgi:hypothetical protein